MVKMTVAAIQPKQAVDMIKCGAHCAVQPDTSWLWKYIGTGPERHESSYMYRSTTMYPKYLFLLVTAMAPCGNSGCPKPLLVIHEQHEEINTGLRILV